MVVTTINSITIELTKAEAEDLYVFIDRVANFGHKLPPTLAHFADSLDTVLRKLRE